LPGRVAPARTQLAGQVDEVIGDALRVEVLGDTVDAAPLAERREIDPDAGFLARAMIHGVDLHSAPAHERSSAGNFPDAGHLAPRRGWAESPQVHERPDGDVVRAAAAFRQAERVGHHGRELRVDVDPAAAGFVVEAAQRGVRAPGAQRLVHGFEALLGAGLEHCRGLWQRACDRHAPRAAHRFAPQHRLARLRRAAGEDEQRQ
jgi:hypothetical protein